IASTRVAQICAQDRRGALLGLGSTLLLYPQPSKADYGDSANVFGKVRISWLLGLHFPGPWADQWPRLQLQLTVDLQWLQHGQAKQLGWPALQVTNKSGYVPYQGDNFAVLLPARWNPSKEREFPGIVLRYEDNAAAANSVMVLREQTDKSSMEEFGAPEQFLQRVAFLLGQQSFSGETESEGGFAPGRVSAASLLGVEAEKDKKGQKTYYNYELFTRTADGEEGGRHYLLRATVSNGQLFILRVTAGDKRWFKGAAKTCKEVTQSFTVA
ncbi:hypothetical protein QJQ45_018991, partial [Haematococcus lacustris]